MSCKVVFSYPVKFVGEVVTVTFDFVAELAVGETILTSSITASLFSGVDPNPAAILSGSSQINGTQVRQLITGGQPNAIYNLLCTITTSNGQTFTPFARLPVKTAPYSE